MMQDKSYCAFISYSHADSEVVAWVHRWLETYRVPPRLVGRKTLVGKVPPRLVPIFRDREELPTSADLGGQIRGALERSKTLIVICSPRSAQSRWVNEEILAYKRLNKAARILCLIIEGEPNCSPHLSTMSQECFAHALRFQLGVDGEISSTPAEPIAADMRPGKDAKQDAMLKLVAGIIGIGFDELKQRHRRRERMRRLGTLLVMCAIGSAFYFAIFLQLAANRKKAEAEIASLQATERRAEAEQEKDRATIMLTKYFEVASKAVFEKMEKIFSPSRETINVGSEEIEIEIAYSVLPNGTHQTAFEPPDSDFLVKGKLPVRIDLHLTLSSPGVGSTSSKNTLLEFTCDTAFSEVSNAWDITFPESRMKRDLLKVKREIFPELVAKVVKEHLGKSLPPQPEGIKN
jgi:hypothetical protein